MPVFPKESSNLSRPRALDLAFQDNWLQIRKVGNISKDCRTTLASGCCFESTGAIPVKDGLNDIWTLGVCTKRSE